MLQPAANRVAEGEGKRNNPAREVCAELAGGLEIEESRVSAFPAGPGLYEPTHDERTFALLVYVLGIFSGFLAPLIFFIVKRDSKYVSFHALQSLAWHIIYFAVFFGAMIVLFISIFVSVGLSSTNNAKPPLAFFGLFGFVWLIGIGGALFNMVLGIVYAVKANKGEWAPMPLIGNWILRKVVYT